MKKMKKAFTMIELIFIIVIIGILAAVALPKLMATRDDAKISVEIASLTQVIFNLGVEYAAQEAFINYTVANANTSIHCFNITELGTNAITVTPLDVASVNCSTIVLSGSRRLAASSSLINTDETEKIHRFGGASIVK